MIMWSAMAAARSLLVALILSTATGVRAETESDEVNAGVAAFDALEYERRSACSRRH
jgi:hypothetical protein